MTEEQTQHYKDRLIEVIRDLEMDVTRRGRHER